MATAASSGGVSDHQYVSVKLESLRLAALDLAPHLFGSHPAAGSWDPSKALPMERAAAAIWELSCVLPSRHETLDFKLLLKAKDDSSECIVEEGPNRPLGCGSNQVEMTDAVFKLTEKDSLECKVWVETEMLSPFDLAASWKAHQENLQPSRVRGTYDVVMNTETEARDELT
ncbi:unnamed protein product [Triticum turgidum subsp. durum]|uniref:CBM20 domain-containing protein n=1 Tax=Triticum turgidum subsp. durum TaxID=4567 RepID=A0A9R0T3U2_TRITD|nr:unnamed protein product [Triticum turgidum subsp. durum]